MIEETYNPARPNIPIQCHDCRKIIVRDPNSCTPGYGIRKKEAFGNQNIRVTINEYVCYECAAKEDYQYMKDHGKITLYLTFDTTKDLPYPHIGHPEPTIPQRNGKYSKLHNIKISNWPGSLSFPVTFMRVGRHNITGIRYDAYMTDLDGNKWHCVRYGDNTELCHCKRLKS